MVEGHGGASAGRVKSMLEASKAVEARRVTHGADSKLLVELRLERGEHEDFFGRG